MKSLKQEMNLKRKNNKIWADERHHFNNVVHFYYFICVCIWDSWHLFGHKTKRNNNSTVLNRFHLPSLSHSFNAIARMNESKADGWAGYGLFTVYALRYRITCYAMNTNIHALTVCTVYVLPLYWCRYCLLYHSSILFTYCKCSAFERNARKLNTN